MPQLARGQILWDQGSNLLIFFERESMKYQPISYLLKVCLSRFVKYESWGFFIEIAFSNCNLGLGPTFSPQKASQKFRDMLCAVRPTFLKSTRDL